MQNSCFSSVVYIQVSPVTMLRPSLRTAAPSHLPLDIKDSLKEDEGFCYGCLLLAFYLRLLLLAFGLGDFGSWMKGGF
jgi:hypothetical protein